MYLTPTLLRDDLSNGFETMLLLKMGFWMGSFWAGGHLDGELLARGSFGLGSFWAWGAFGTGELFLRSFYFGGLLVGSFSVGSFFLGSLCPYTVKCYLTLVSKNKCFALKMYYCTIHYPLNWISHNAHPLWFPLIAKRFKIQECIMPNPYCRLIKT